MISYIKGKCCFKKLHITYIIIWKTLWTPTYLLTFVKEECVINVLNKNKTVTAVSRDRRMGGTKTGEQRTPTKLLAIPGRKNVDEKIVVDEWTSMQLIPVANQKVIETIAGYSVPGCPVKEVCGKI